MLDVSMTRRASGMAARNCVTVCGSSLLGSTITSSGVIWAMGDFVASSMEAYSATTWYRVASSRRTSPWRNSRCGSISRVGTGFIGILHRGNLSRRKPCVAALHSELLHKPTTSFVFFMSRALMSQPGPTGASVRAALESTVIVMRGDRLHHNPSRFFLRDCGSLLRHFALFEV